MKMKRFIAMLLAVVMIVGLVPPVTAVTATPLTLGQSETVNAAVGETVAYSFTPNTAGDYVLYYNFAPATGVEFSLQAGCSASYFVGTTSYHVMNLAANETATFTITPGVDAVANGSIGVANVQALTGITPDSASVGCKEGDTIFVRVTPNAFSAPKLTWNVDPSVAEIISTDGCDAHVKLLAAGDTAIAVTAVDQQDSNNSYSCTINVHVDPSNSVKSYSVNENEAIHITANADETVEVTFMPSASGYYWLKNHNDVGWSHLYVENEVNAFDYDEGNFAGSVYYLTAGNTYTLTEDFEEAHSFTISIEQVTTATNVEFKQPTMHVQVGSLIDPTLEFTGGILGTRFNIDNTNVTWQPDGMNAHSCRYLMIGDGKVIITANTVNNHDSSISFAPTCTVTVDPAAYHETVTEGTTPAVPLNSGDNAVLEFTPDADGTYFVGHTGDKEMSWLIIDRAEGQDIGFGPRYQDSSRRGNLMQLEQGKLYWLVFNAKENLSTEFIVTKQIPATGITFTDTDIETNNALTVEKDQETTVYMTMTPNGAVDVLSFTSSNPAVAEVVADSGDSFNIRGYQAGSTAITVTTGGGATRTLEVTVEESTTPPPAEPSFDDTWQITQQAGEMVAHTYTPTENGFYFIGTDPVNGEPLKLNDTTVKSYDWDDSDGWGFVYELKANTAYTFESTLDYGRTFTMFVKKVEEAQSFTIPATLSGKVGETLELPFTFTGTLSTHPVSDKEYVVKCDGGNARVEQLKLLSEGTAVITVTDHHGNVQTCTVTVGPADGIMDAYNGTDLDLPAGGSTQYYFTPDTTGLKVLYVGGETPMTVTIQNADGSDVEDSYQCVVFGSDAVAATLTGLTKYLVTVSSDQNGTGTLWFQDAQTADSINTWGNTEYGATEGDIFTITYELQGSTSGIAVDQLTAKSDNESVVKVLSVNNTHVKLQAVDGGTATVTVTLTNGASAAFTATVNGFNNQGSVDVGETTLTLDSQEDTRFTFKPDESGMYWISTPESSGVGMWLMHDNDINPDSFSHRANGKNGEVYTLEAEKTYTFAITPSQESAVDVSVAKVTEATDFTINGGKNITGMAGTELTVYFTAGENELIRVSNATSSNEDVFTTGDRQNDYVRVYLANSGTAELTVTLENGTEKKIQVTVQTYEDQATGFWEGQPEEWGYVEFTFTPDADGFYFLNYRYEMTHFEISNAGDTPLMSFEYNDRQQYTGYVYKLEAGKTYSIRSQGEFSGYYAVYMHKVDEATDFTINLDENVEKKVGNNAWLNIQANGVMGNTITSDNKNVAVVGSPSPHGSYIFFVGEGTATITVTDHNDKSKTYEITVAGTAEIRDLHNDEEIGLAANGSISYYFTPESDGKYWIRPNQKAELGITVQKTADQSNVTATDWAEEGSSGILVDLTAGEEYLVTFTSETAGTAQIKLEPVETPWSIMLEGETMRIGFVGDVMTLRYFWEPPMAYTDVTVQSSNPTVVEILGHDNMCFGVKLVSVGEAEVTISTANGNSVSCMFTVKELREETILLDEEKTVQLSDGDIIRYNYAASESGYVYLWQSHRGMSNLDIYGLDANNDRYSLTHFNHDWQGDVPGGHGAVFQVEAGKTYRFCVESYGDTDTTVKLESVQKATSVTMDKTEISGYAGQEIRVNFTLEPAGSFVVVENVRSDNETVAWVNSIGSDGIGVYLEHPDQTHITMEINGETVTIPVTVKDITDVLQPGEENALTFTLDPGETAACLYESTYAGKMYFYGNGNYEIKGADFMDRYEFGNYVSTGSQLGYLYRNTYMMGENQTYTVLVTNPYDTRMDIVVTADGLVDMVDMEIVAQDAYQLGEEFEIFFKPVPINSEPENPYELIFDPEDALLCNGQNPYGAGLVGVRLGTVTISLEGLGYEDQHTINIWADSIGLNEDKKVTVPYNVQKVLTFTAPEDGFYNITFTAPKDTFAMVEEITPWMPMDPDGDHSISVQMTKGETYVLYYQVQGMGESADVTIKVTDDAEYITKLEIMREPDKKSYYRDYLDQAFTLEGIVLGVTWSDGREEEYDFQRLMQTEGMLGDYPIAYDVAAQNGDTITIAVGTSYQYDTFDITLTDCNITGFEVLGPANLTIPANAYGAMEEPGWIYSGEFIREFLQFKISFDDGTSVTVPGTQAAYEGYGLFDSIPNDQYDNLWELNETYTMLFGFLDFFDEFEVTIAPNPVQSIEVLTPPSTEFVFGNEDYGIVEPEGGYTFVPGNYDQYKGLSFKVTYTDGTSEIVTPDQFTWPYGSDYGDTCFGWYKGFPVETYVNAGYFYGEYQLGELFTEPGSVTMGIRYGWADDEYTLTLKAPHEHDLTVVPAKEATCTEDGNIRHWVCSGCDVLFGDAEGKQILTKEEVTLTDGEHSYYDGWVPAEEYHCHKCELCGYEKDITNHSAFVNKVDSAYLFDANDCVEFYYKQCPDCGRGSDPDQVFSVARENAVHVWDDGTVTTAATCTEAGEMTYHCTNEGCEATKTEEIKRAPHNLSETKGKAATCTEDGNINFWTCNDCKTKFADAEGKTEITGTITLTKTGHVVSKVEAKAATCTEDGNVEYWTCTACKENFADKAATQKITDVTVKAEGHKLTEVARKEATCTEDGNVQYWSCSGCDVLFGDAEGKNEVTDVVIAKGHKLTEVPAKEATYEAPGNMAHWSCSGCDVLFGDAEGKTTVTNVVIPQLIKVEEEKAEINESFMDNAIDNALNAGSDTDPEEPTEPGEEPDEPGDSGSTTEAVKEILLPVKNNTPESTVNSVSLPVTSIEKIVDANEQIEEEVVLTVEMDSATVTLDSKALEAVAEQVGSAEVTLVVEEIETAELNKVQQNIVKNRPVEMIISAELVGGDTSVHDFQGGSVTIKLPFTPKEGTKGNDYSILYVADNGKIEKIKTTYVDGHLVFTLTHFSEYVVVNEQVAEEITKPESSNPDTGDGTNVLLLAVLMFSAAAAMAVLEVSKKRYVR